MRRIDFIFLAMLTLAAALASAPPPSKAPSLGEAEAWAVMSNDRVTLSGLDLSGNAVGP